MLSKIMSKITEVFEEYETKVVPYAIILALASLIVGFFTGDSALPALWVSVAVLLIMLRLYDMTRKHMETHVVEEAKSCIRAGDVEEINIDLVAADEEAEGVIGIEEDGSPILRPLSAGPVGTKAPAKKEAVPQEVEESKPETLTPDVPVTDKETAYNAGPKSEGFSCDKHTNK